MKKNPKDEKKKPVFLSAAMKACPIQTSLGVLGRKWTLLILRNLYFVKFGRFNQMLHMTPGLTPRVLSMRLSELEISGFIKRIGKQNSSTVQWELTEKGNDTLPILMSLVAFGSKWNANHVFVDEKPRTLKELFPKNILQIYDAVKTRQNI